MGEEPTGNTGVCSCRCWVLSEPLTSLAIFFVPQLPSKALGPEMEDEDEEDDSEDAINEFDFLGSGEDGDGSADPRRCTGDGAPHELGERGVVSGCRCSALCACSCFLPKPRRTETLPEPSGRSLPGQASPVPALGIPRDLRAAPFPAAGPPGLQEARTVPAGLMGGQDEGGGGASSSSPPHRAVRLGSRGQLGPKALPGQRLAAPRASLSPQFGAGGSSSQQLTPRPPWALSPQRAGGSNCRGFWPTFGMWMGCPPK